MPKLTVADLIPGNLERALTLASEGKPHAKIIEALGVSSATYYNLKHADTSFASRMERAREQGAESIMESMLTLIEDNPDLDPNVLRIKADAYKFYLTRAWSSKYGDQIKVTNVAVDIGTAITDGRQRAGVTIDITPQPQQLEANDPYE